MKKIGVVTIYDVTNYGNRLQNYAVVTVLKKLGYNVKTVTPLSWIGMLYKADRYGKSLQTKKPANKQIHQNAGTASKSVLLDRLSMFSLRLIYSILFSLKYTPSISVKKLGEDYGSFVCGSDQIWNPDFSGQEFFFAGFAPKAKKIAYAASFGVSELSDEIKQIYKPCLENMDAISVRENTGADLVREIADKKAITVIDPTMMINSSEWSKVAKKPLFKAAKEYIFVYLLGEISDDKKQYMENIAKENNLELIILKEDAKIWNKVGPCEFIWLISHSKAVITDSFHGMAFSIINSKPFIALERKWSFKSMNSRVDTLLNSFGLEHCRFANQSSEEFFSQDYEDVYSILENKRKESLEFLCEALK